MPKQTAPTNAEVSETTSEQPDQTAAPSNWDALQSYNQGNGYQDPFDAAARPAALPDDFEIAVDTSQVDTISRLPIGTYHGRCIGIRAGKPSAKGDPCWIWTLQATEGPQAGGVMDMYTYTGPTTLWKFAEVKRALGFEDRETITPAAVRNRACTFVVTQSVYQGNPRLQVDTVTMPQKAPLGSTVEFDPAASIPF